MSWNHFKEDVATSVSPPEDQALCPTNVSIEITNDDQFISVHMVDPTEPDNCYEYAQVYRMMCQLQRILRSLMLFLYWRCLFLRYRILVSLSSFLFIS